MSAAALKELLRADLKSAMQARASDDVSVLRTLIAALDNAEAQPSAGIQDSTLPRAFGDPVGEVARLKLNGNAVDRVLAAEIEARLAAATDYERHQRPDESARLRAEADLIARYRVT